MKRVAVVVLGVLLLVAAFWLYTRIATDRSSDTAPPPESPVETETLSVVAREYRHRAPLPNPFMLDRIRRQLQVLPLELQGVSSSGVASLALLSGRVLAPGDTFAGFTVETIDQRGVALLDSSGVAITVTADRP